MSAATIEETAPASPEPAEREPASLWRYQLWVHLGDGAEECEGVDERSGKVTCGDRSHFHAWLRLPNQFQQREIETAAMGAKARKVRQLRDEATNAYAILQDGLDELADSEDPDAALQVIAEELIGVNSWRDYLDAMREVLDLSDPDWTAGPDDEDDAEPPKLYGDIESDRVRFAELLGREDADTDEVDELRRHMQDYEDEVEQRVKAAQAPRRQAILDGGLDLAIEKLRRKRVATLAQEEFMATYSAHEWLSCTYREVDGKPYWASMDEMRAAPAPVLTLVESSFADLERTARSAGN